MKKLSYPAKKSSFTVKKLSSPAKKSSFTVKKLSSPAKKLSFPEKKSLSSEKKLRFPVKQWHLLAKKWLSAAGKLPAAGKQGLFITNYRLKTAITIDGKIVSIKERLNYIHDNPVRND